MPLLSSRVQQAEPKVGCVREQDRLVRRENVSGANQSKRIREMYLQLTDLFICLLNGLCISVGGTLFLHVLVSTLASCWFGFIASYAWSGAVDRGICRSNAVCHEHI